MSVCNCPNDRFTKPSALRTAGPDPLADALLGDAPNCGLGGELEVLPQIPMAQLVQVERPNGPRLEGPRSQPILSFIQPLEGAAQDVRFLGRRVSFMLSTGFKCEEKQGAAFLYRLEATVFSGGFL